MFTNSQINRLGATSQPIDLISEIVDRLIVLNDEIVNDSHMVDMEWNFSWTNRNNLMSTG
jgi:hypothetical protein